MMGIDDIFIGFLISYIAGSLPSLKDVFFKTSKRSMKELVENCYNEALKKWMADSAVRESIAQQEPVKSGKLQDLCNYPEKENYATVINDLLKLWSEEIQKYEELSNYIQTQEIKAVGDKVDKLIEVLLKQGEVEESHLIRRGLTIHKPVEGYIRRYCASDNNESNYLSYLLGTKERHTLADYVVGIEPVGANKFILYSSAQTGKTTELKQLCWELQQSGLFLPVCFEVRNNTRLKRGDLPDFQYSGTREVVVVIDALDEVNGQKYEDLLEEIGGYAYDHPEIKIVLSCRSNYRRESQLNLFKELFLEELSTGDAIAHIDNVLGKGNGLFSVIRDNELRDFIKNPFFLNVLIDAYKDNPLKMPKTKVGIYRLFIEKSYRNERNGKTVPLKAKHSFEESLKLLERVALGLSLTNAQTLSAEELRECLLNDDNVEECLRYDLIRCEDGLYSFKHNAFREWLVANYLYRSGLKKAKQLATHPNGRIKPEWYNIIMLWVSMYGIDRQEEINAILGWLKEASLDLVIYIDKEMLSETIRDEVFKGLLLEYKALGIRMANIMTNDYQDLLKFGQSKGTVSFMVEEISEAHTGTAYYADLMYLCYFLNWDKLYFDNKELTEALFRALEKKTSEVLVGERSHDLSFLYLNNIFFAKKEYVERIYSVLGKSNHYEAIKSMIRLIDAAGCVDEYIDYILEKEGYVHNQHEGYTTHVVSRDVIYETLSKTKSLDGVKKLLQHQFQNTHTLYHDEQDAYRKMMTEVLNRVCDYIKTGNEELADVLENYYKTLFKEYHYHFDHNKESAELLQILRNCYIKSGLRERGRKVFYEKQNNIFAPHKEETTNWESTRLVFTMAALWITVEDVENDFSRFSPSNEYDWAKASWYREIPVAEVAECASRLYQQIFPQPSSFIKGRERRQKAFNDFADYPVFKQLVLEMVADLDEHTTRREHGRKLRDLDEGYNTYAFSFILQFVKPDDTYDVNGIIKGIKNKSLYDAFFMKEIEGKMTFSNNELTITEEMKSRCLDYAKETVLNICTGSECFYGKDALSLLMRGYFDITPELLPKLLDYGYISISRKDEDGFFNREYSLFEYVTERIELEKLAPLVIEKLKNNVDNENYRLSYDFANYLLKNHVEEGYGLVLRFALSGYSMSSNILEELIKTGKKTDEIKSASKSMDESDRVFCYSSLVRNAGEEKWVKERLEHEYKTFSGYALKRALQLLLSIGSMDALDYLHMNPEIIRDGDDFHFLYDNPNAVPSLCYFIAYIDEHKLDSHFILNSILTSLERIAVKSMDALLEVKGYLRQLTQKGQRFKYLNRLILSYEDKYYAAGYGVTSIKEAMVKVDSDEDTKTGKKVEENRVWGENDGVYISYNWEGHSSHIVDFLCFVFENKGIPYLRDKNDCNYLDNIKEFMNAIRVGKTVIVVFSRPYLKSKNCMYELSGIMKDPCYKDRILPVVVDDTIRESQFYVDLVKYWKEEKDKQEDIVKQLLEIDGDMAEPQQTKLNEIKDVYALLKGITEYIDWVNAENLDAMCATRFRTIIDKIIERKRNE